MTDDTRVRAHLSCRPTAGMPSEAGGERWGPCTGARPDLDHTVDTTTEPLPPGLLVPLGPIEDVACGTPCTWRHGPGATGPAPGEGPGDDGAGLGAGTATDHMGNEDSAWQAAQALPAGFCVPCVPAVPVGSGDCFWELDLELGLEPARTVNTMHTLPCTPASAGAALPPTAQDSLTRLPFLDIVGAPSLGHNVVNTDRRAPLTTWSTPPRCGFVPAEGLGGLTGTSVGRLARPPPHGPGGGMHAHAHGAHGLGPAASTIYGDTHLGRGMATGGGGGGGGGGNTPGATGPKAGAAAWRGSGGRAPPTWQDPWHDPWRGTAAGPAHEARWPARVAKKNTARARGKGRGAGCRNEVGHPAHTTHGHAPRPTGMPAVKVEADTDGPPSPPGSHRPPLPLGVLAMNVKAYNVWAARADVIAIYGCDKKALSEERRRHKNKMYARKARERKKAKRGRETRAAAAGAAAAEVYLEPSSACGAACYNAYT